MLRITMLGCLLLLCVGCVGIYVDGSVNTSEQEEMSICEQKQDENLSTLMAWTTHISGYPKPSCLPEIKYRTHNFFVRTVCNWKECNVEAWYNDENIIYLNEEYKDGNTASFDNRVIHEFVHYLQYISGKFNPHSCDDSWWRELEAHRVLTAYLLETKTHLALGQQSRRLVRHVCNYSHVAAVAPAQNSITKW